MKFRPVHNIKFGVCKSDFFRRNRCENLPQHQLISNFIKNANITDVAVNEHKIDRELNIVLINQGYISLDELSSLIKSASKCSTKYLCLCINKFYVYSTCDRDTKSVENFDMEL